MRKTIAIVITCAALAFLHPSFRSTNAVFAQGANGQSNQFAGATFSPTVAPVVSPSASANNISLSWMPVTNTSGVAVSYVVMRYSLTAAAAQVCVNGDTPVTQGNSISCTDNSAVNGVSYWYTEQPVVIIGAQSTWSLAASSASISLCLKKCK